MFALNTPTLCAFLSPIGWRKLILWENTPTTGRESRRSNISYDPRPLLKKCASTVSEFFYRLVQNSKSARSIQADFQRNLLMFCIVFTIPILQVRLGLAGVRVAKREKGEVSVSAEDLKIHSYQFNWRWQFTSVIIVCKYKWDVCLPDRPIYNVRGKRSHDLPASAPASELQKEENLILKSLFVVRISIRSTLRSTTIQCMIF